MKQRSASSMGLKTMGYDGSLWQVTTEPSGRRRRNVQFSSRQVRNWTVGVWENDLSHLCLPCIKWGLLTPFQYLETSITERRQFITFSLSGFKSTAFWRSFMFSVLNLWAGAGRKQVLVMRLWGQWQFLALGSTSEKAEKSYFPF